MTNDSVFAILLEQQKQIRQLALELEALKRMFFEHRPPFVQAFAQQVGAVEASGFLLRADEMIQRLKHSSKAR